MLTDEPNLFSVDVRRLEDRPPLFDLGLLLGGERFERLLLARWNVLTLIGKSLPYGWVGQSSLHRLLSLVMGSLGVPFA
jgi:hypothetical protein